MGDGVVNPVSPYASEQLLPPAPSWEDEHNNNPETLIPRNAQCCRLKVRLGNAHLIASCQCVLPSSFSGGLSAVQRILLMAGAFSVRNPEFSRISGEKKGAL